MHHQKLSCKMHMATYLGRQIIEMVLYFYLLVHLQQMKFLSVLLLIINFISALLIQVHLQTLRLSMQFVSTSLVLVP